MITLESPTYYGATKKYNLNYPFARFFYVYLWRLGFLRTVYRL